MPDTPLTCTWSQLLHFQGRGMSLHPFLPSLSLCLGVTSPRLGFFPLPRSSWPLRTHETPGNLVFSQVMDNLLFSLGSVHRGRHARSPVWPYFVYLCYWSSLISFHSQTGRILCPFGTLSVFTSLISPRDRLFGVFIAIRSLFCFPADPIWVAFLQRLYAPQISFLLLLSRSPQWASAFFLWFPFLLSHNCGGAL